MLLSSILIVASLALILWLWEASITGHVSESMHCSSGECNELCKQDADCFAADYVCCDNGGYGVCKPHLNCGKAYSLPAFNTKISHMETPAGNLQNWIFPLLILLTITLGAIYIVEKKH